MTSEPALVVRSDRRGSSEPDASRRARPRAATRSTASPSEKPTKKESGSGKPALATTDEVPVGGGIVLMDERIVIVQPTAGKFAAWSAICKHEGETVGSVENNVITCPFHGSQYDSATGDVVAGPAPTGLDPIRITVAGGRITRA